MTEGIFNTIKENDFNNRVRQALLGKYGQRKTFEEIPLNIIEIISGEEPNIRRKVTVKIGNGDSLRSIGDIDSTLEEIVRSIYQSVDLNSELRSVETEILE